MKRLWNEIKYYWNRFRNIKHIGTYVFVAVLVLFLLRRLFFPSGPSLIDAIGALKDAKSYDKQTELYNQQVEQMLQHIEVLSTSKDSLEKVAREKFLLCEPDEDVFIVEE